MLKKLGRFTRPGHRVLGRGRGRYEEGAGYQQLHVCVDDFSRLVLSRCSTTSAR